MRVQGSGREREKDTHMVLKYEISEAEKSTPCVLYWLKNYAMQEIVFTPFVQDNI